MMLTTLAQMTESLAHEPYLPMLPAASEWPGLVLILAGGLFLAAAVIGPVMRANADDPLPPHASVEHH
jgi:hypothetical protein